MRQCAYVGCKKLSVKDARGLCRMHYDISPDGSTVQCLVSGCGADAAVPITEKLCAGHSPRHAQETTIEAVAFEAMAEGKNPIQAVVETGLATRNEAKALVQGAKGNPAFQERMLRLAKKAGIRRADGMRAIKRALDAKVTKSIKSGVDELGDPVFKTVELGDDHRVQVHAAALYHSLVDGKPTQKVEIDAEHKVGIVFLAKKDPLPFDTRVIEVIDDNKDR